VVDGLQRRISYSDRDYGTLMLTTSYEVPVASIERTTESTEYPVGCEMSDSLFMETPKSTRSVSYVTEDPTPSILLAGCLHTSGRRAVYVPSYFPVVFTFSPSDTMGVAYPTPEYGEVPTPETTTRHTARFPFGDDDPPTAPTALPPTGTRPSTSIACSTPTRSRKTPFSPCEGCRHVALLPPPSIHSD
jgi:hypothetical protein